MEKRRKAFGDNLRTYLVAEKGIGHGSHPPGINGVIREDEPESQGLGEAGERHEDGYNLRRRGTAPAELQ